ncbi:hypothetical protein [Iodobacter fluviatilis]|uniref:EamA domain-containing protein n=1 Tax=Iodobacter fluviatilis TaxID=537 RepID=A0A377Q7J3_9NEIS|nr:hypothetical protein [Iodobacter fluviatilis]TCU89462.1 hypothetical protein EV682_102374 [Iodobacter fluviatilis]STQ90832.1 Uncharacterised protein [Iodobacter fluviatilis]
MNQEKSDEYQKAEGKMALVIFVVFCVWGGTYLFFVRPLLNEFLGEHKVASYPAILHLIPILGPVIILAMLLGRALPSKH